MPTRLAARRKQGAIVARLLVVISTTLAREYRRKHVGAVFGEILVAMAIRQNDYESGKPLTISCIAKILNMPRSNVKRATTILMARGVIVENNGTFTENPAFVAGRMDTECARTIIAAILKAAADLA
jgi:DNA-binding MarR family transcriptional regulator